LNEEMKKKTKVAEKGDPRIDRKERVKSDCVEKDKERDKIMDFLLIKKIRRWDPDV
jgi:hypothetical protein